jgi:hypothetical protein
MSGERLLLCRPQGGLNDILCQIEKACRYADRFDRTVIVETDCASAMWFKDRFCNYFLSRRRRLVLDAAGARDGFDRLAAVPACLAGRVNGYEAAYDFAVDNFADAESGAPLSFDFERDYAEPLLVHHACGGGQLSLGALARMRAHDAIVDRLVRRMATIGEGYVGVHIRNTDYQTDYQPALNRLAGEIAGPIFVASDNRQAVADCRRLFGAARVFSFAQLPEEPGRPPHRLQGAETTYQVHADAILDLLTLALADRVYGFRLAQNRHGTEYSGFTMLAINLNNAKQILAGVIGRSDPVLDRRIGVAAAAGASAA